MLDKGGSEVHGVFETHKARAAVGVHDLFFGWHAQVGTVRYDFDDFQCLPDQNVFSNLTAARIYVVNAFRNERCFVNRSTQACEMGGKDRDRSTFSMS